MKRIILFLLLLSLTLSCLGCQGGTDAEHAFYYLRTENSIAYGKEDALIAAESQDLGQDMDLEDILRLYLNGPAEEKLRSPFPKETQLLSVAEESETLTLVLSLEFSTLDGIQLTLAGACLTATCHDLTGIETIRVCSGENTYDFALSSFVLLDSSPEQ